MFSTSQIGLTKFNNKTYKENKLWKKKKDWEGAVYGFQYNIPESIQYNSYLYIIEMNNETNKIMGIGFIRNEYRSEWRTRIYNENEDYNRFVLKSKYHRNRKYLLEKNKDIIVFLENILFYGSGHLKRSSNFTLSLDKIAKSPFITTPIKNINKKKKEYKCSKCGLPKRNHICKGVNPNLKKICKICGKYKLKGNSTKHHCIQIKNVDNVNKVLKFLHSLFD